jgi:hypothetical protein
MAGVLDKAVIAAKDSGRVLQTQMQSKTILKEFHYPIDPFYWRRNITSPYLFKNLFGSVHSVEQQLKFCLPFNDFVSIKNLVNRCRTDMLPYFLKDFTSKYSNIAEGLGSEMLELLPALLLQQSVYMLSTNSLATPGTQLFSELLVTDDCLPGESAFGKKALNSFTALATQIVIGSNYFGSNLKTLKFIPTCLDLALLVETETGSRKLIGVEIKTSRSLDELSNSFDLYNMPGAPKKNTFTNNFFNNPQRFDELVLIIHTCGKFTIEERANFELLFYRRYEEEIKTVDFKLVFM